MSETTMPKAVKAAHAAAVRAMTDEPPEQWMFRQAAILSDLQSRWWARPLRRYLAPLQAGLAAHAVEVRRMTRCLDDMIDASQAEVELAVNRYKIVGGQLAMDSTAIELEIILRNWKPKNVDTGDIP